LTKQQKYGKIYVSFLFGGVMSYNFKYENSPMGKYVRQRANARNRGIIWKFTFNSWWKVWEDSGKWEQRGKGPGQFYMCRYNDTGPYSPDNVRIQSHSENTLEWYASKDRSDPFTPYPRTSAWDYPHEYLDKLKKT
jgi:hypothetical protein